MNTLEKLALLSENMSLEPAEDVQPSFFSSTPQAANRKKPDDPPPVCHPGIFQAALPGGKHVPILKTLLTSACERNCYYCPFRAGRDMRRETFKPDEMADLFDRLYNSGYVQGLFLSSGIAGGGVRSQDKLIDTVEIVRKKRRFSGYLHLKLLPGADRDQIRRVMQLADRVSINLEAPNQKRLDHLAPLKTFLEELYEPLRWAEEIRRTEEPVGAWKGRWPSLATQFVVGAAGETDLELLATTERLFRDLRLTRVYYSPFNPVENTPLDGIPPENPLRPFRLYQASFLLRDYGFDMEDLPFTGSGQLPLDIDPKRAWADANLLQSPLEINRAERSELLRVPGIGPKTAEAILAGRRREKIRSVQDLQALGIRVQPLSRYVLLDGKRPIHQPRPR